MELSGSSLFAQFEPADCQALLQVATKRICAADEVILRSGAPNSSLFIVASGKVKASRTFRNEEVPLATIQPHESFGELSALEEGPAAATITALEPTELWEITAVALEGFLATRPDLAARFWRNVAKALRKRLVETNALVLNYVQITRSLVEDPTFRAFYSQL